MDKDEYEKQLLERQMIHLKMVDANKNKDWKPCLHDLCQSCHGTGVKLDGSLCVHRLHCDCAKCRHETIQLQNQNQS